MRASDDSGALAGAAFLVGYDLALTCAHVIRDHLGLGRPTPGNTPQMRATLRFERLGREVGAKVVGWWPDGGGGDLDDIAVLSLDEPIYELDPVGLASESPRQRRDCYIYGAVTGYSDVGQTVNAMIAAQPNARGWLQLDAEAGSSKAYFVEKGFSGAPVFDPLGNTIWGMVVAVDDNERLVAFAIPVEDLREAERDAARGLRAEQQPEIVAESLPGPLDALAREAFTALRLDYERQLAQEREAAARQVEELRTLLRTLADRAKDPAERARIEAVLDAAREGETAPAERMMEGELEKAPEETLDQRAAAAEIARQLGALAYINDTAKAIKAYRVATELDPDDTCSWIYLGRLEHRAGDLAAAERAFEQALAAAEREGNERSIGVAHHELGTVRQVRGDLADALEAYERYRDTAEKLAKQDPGNAQWQRDLSVSFERIGDVRVARGDLAGALQAYEQGRAIREQLAARDPGNAQWQRDLSVSFERIGDVRVDQGDLAGALEAYEQGRAIAEQLAARDPANAQWQRDLSVSFERIGDVRVAQGNLAGALEAYEDSLAIREKLANQDPGNAEWQRDLSVSLNKIGDVRVAQGDLAGALEAYEQGRAIAERLAARDPGNAAWQRDLIVSNVKLAEVAQQDGRPGDARRHYAAALQIATMLQAGGRLAPVDDWMVVDLEARLAAVTDPAAEP